MADTTTQCDKKECADYETEGCYARSPNGYRCTRDINHDGPHIACAGDIHDLDTWDAPE